jgi:hypothetical protein
MAMSWLRSILTGTWFSLAAALALMELTALLALLERPELPALLEQLAPLVLPV